MAVADRFWSKVDRSGGPDACWVWTGALHTAVENVMRGVGVGPTNAAKTSCPMGHALTRVKAGRYCRTCHNERQRVTRPSRATRRIAA